MLCMLSMAVVPTQPVARASNMTLVSTLQMLKLNDEGKDNQNGNDDNNDKYNNSNNDKYNNNNNNNH